MSNEMPLYTGPHCDLCGMPAMGLHRLCIDCDHRRLTAARDAKLTMNRQGFIYDPSEDYSVDNWIRRRQGGKT